LNEAFPSVVTKRKIFVTQRIQYGGMMDDENLVGVPAANRPLPGAVPGGLLARSERPGAELHVRAFAGVPAEVPEARAFAARALDGCPAGDSLLVCVTELAANAIEHTLSGAGGAFTVEVARPADGVAYVAVTDGGGDDWPVPGTGWPADPATAAEDTAHDDDVAGLAEGGRGLVLVAACSSRWGYAKASGPSSGCTIWAEATWRVPIGARC
jgi:hypothetical protein